MDCFVAALLAMTENSQLICLAPLAPVCLTLRRVAGRGLSLGTVAERIAPESVTRLLSGFVHRNISRWRLGHGTRSSLARLHKGPIGAAFLKSSARAESNQKRQRVKSRVVPRKRDHSLPLEGVAASGPPVWTPTPQPLPARWRGAIECAFPHCVLAT